jgi:hypothetical protein
MYKTIAWVFILLSIVHSAVSSGMHKASSLCLYRLVSRLLSDTACTANAVVVETSGQWQEGHEIKRVFEIHLQNTHAVCSLSDSVTVKIQAPPGSRVSYSWGMSNGEITGLALAPGQSFSGPGFVLSGMYLLFLTFPSFPFFPFIYPPSSILPHCEHRTWNTYSYGYLNPNVLVRK